MFKSFFLNLSNNDKSQKITTRAELIHNVPVALVCSQVGNPKDFHFAASTPFYERIYRQSVKLLPI